MGSDNPAIEIPLKFEELNSGDLESAEQKSGDRDSAEPKLSDRDFYEICGTEIW